MSIVLALAAVVLVSSCGNGEDGDGNEAQRPQVLLLLKSDATFFAAIESGFRAELGRGPQTEDLAVRHGEHESDVRGQLTALRAFIRTCKHSSKSRTSALVLTPSGSSSELTSAIAELNKLHVPVILVDTLIDSDALKAAGAHFDCFIGSSNEAGGEAAARLVISSVKPGSSVLLLNGVDGHETAMARRRGFLLGIESANIHPPLRITERTCNWQRNMSATVVRSLLALGRTFDAVFAANDEMALGALESYRQRSQEAPAIIGFDAIPEARTSVQSGGLHATLAQDPEGMGRRAVKTLRRLWAAEELPEDERIQLLNVVPVERK